MPDFNRAAQRIESWLPPQQGSRHLLLYIASNKTRRYGQQQEQSPHWLILRPSLFHLRHPPCHALLFPASVIPYLSPAGTSSPSGRWACTGGWCCRASPGTPAAVTCGCVRCLTATKCRASEGRGDQQWMLREAPWDRKGALRSGRHAYAHSERAMAKGGTCYLATLPALTCAGCAGMGRPQHGQTEGNCPVALRGACSVLLFLCCKASMWVTLAKEDEILSRLQKVLTMRKGDRSEQYPDVPRCISRTFGVPNRCTSVKVWSRLG
jgi:hypothetical protein